MKNVNKSFTYDLLYNPKHCTQVVTFIRKFGGDLELKRLDLMEIPSQLSRLHGGDSQVYVGSSAFYSCSNSVQKKRFVFYGE